MFTVKAERSGATAAGRFGPLLLVVLVGLLIDAPRLRDELRFFHGPNLVAADGGAPVLQDDQATPAIDNAFRTVARILAPGVTCVIARDSWHRDYFRASYLLMPHQVWPVAALLVDPLPTALQITTALHEYAAQCLLAPASLAVPSGMQLLWRGDYNLYHASTTRQRS